MYNSRMIFPLKELIEYDGNIYEITCASTKRAFQLAKLQDKEIERQGSKVVSVGARQIFTGEVDYQLEYQSEYN